MLRLILLILLAVLLAACFTPVYCMVAPTTIAYFLAAVTAIVLVTRIPKPPRKAA